MAHYWQRWLYGFSQLGMGTDERQISRSDIQYFSTIITEGQP
jgi:hypothetical protein